MPCVYRSIPCIVPYRVELDMLVQTELSFVPGASAYSSCAGLLAIWYVLLRIDTRYAGACRQGLEQSTS
ncbi:hypothetical protein B296_00049370 [Ensete ventricosum]|uniref:Uncharacterized protein n=1 Tax=Ensete ventricosum TaxID=4639 RepID=A0A426YJ83_ENSVE|nr:hypothetical protein B296_00049370 [Ensete ventricosum]